MSLLLTAAKVAEQALRDVGALPSSEKAADPQQLAVTLTRLDLIVAEEVGIQRFWWFVPANQSVALEGGKAEYDLSGLSSPLQFFFKAWLVKDGRKRPLEIERRGDFEDHEFPAETGAPDTVYIERKDRPKMRVHPVLAANATGYTVELAGQAFADNLSASNGAGSHGFPASWQLYLIKRVALDIGGGAVVALPADKIRDLKDDIREKRALLPRSIRENASRPRYTKARSF